MMTEIKKNWNGSLKPGRKRFKNYIHRCKRCGEFYNTPKKGSMFCEGCKKPIGGNVRVKK